MPAPALSRPELNVVAPMYNEGGNVERFVEAVHEVLSQQDIAYELIVVDDGSSDDTWANICEQRERNPAVKGIRLSRNFGHQNALFAGLAHVNADAAISMDGDLQHPPSELPRLIAAWRDGYQVVTTKRIDSQDTGALKRWSSSAFYRLFSLMTGVKLNAGSSDFRLLDARVLDAVTQMRDVDLFVRGMVNWLGFRATCIPIQAGNRHSGQTKYTLRKMLRFSAGAMVSFSMLPLRIGIWAGFLTIVLAFLQIIYSVYHYFQGHTLPGWASVMSLMSLMFGMLFILLGIVGLYIGKIYDVLKERPRFVVGQYARLRDATALSLPVYLNLFDIQLVVATRG